MCEGLRLVDEVKPGLQADERKLLVEGTKDIAGIIPDMCIKKEEVLKEFLKEP